MWQESSSQPTNCGSSPRATELCAGGAPVQEKTGLAPQPPRIAQEALGFPEERAGRFAAIQPHLPPPITLPSYGMASKIAFPARLRHGSRRGGGRRGGKGQTPVVASLPIVFPATRLLWGPPSSREAASGQPPHTSCSLSEKGCVCIFLIFFFK